MTDLEVSKENLKDSQKGLLETESSLSDLKVGTNLTGLRAEVGVGDWFGFRRKSKKSNEETAGGNVENSKGKFEYKNESKDKEYDVYLYTVNKGGKSKDIIKQAVKQGIAKEKEGILITNQDGELYEKKYKFSAGEQVYVKVPKKISNRSSGNGENNETQPTHQVNVAGGGRNKLDSKEHPENKRIVSEQWMYDKCIEYGVTDKRQIAYILATVKHEAPNPSGTGFKNRIEVGKGQGKKYGEVDKSTGYAYYGRGFPQITWKDAYKTYTRIIKNSGKNFKLNDGNVIKGSEVDLLRNPDIILDSNELSAFILIDWMKNGGPYRKKAKRLDSYINDEKTDYIHARRIINGNDRAAKVANIAKTYLSKLGNESSGSLENPGEGTKSSGNGLSGVETHSPDGRNSNNSIGLEKGVNNSMSLKHERESSDGYEVYSLILPTTCTPLMIKQNASDYLSSKNSEGIKITNSDGNEYPDYQLISSGEKVYIKVSKDKQIQGMPVYENKLQDGHYDVYSYTCKSWVPMLAFSLKDKIAKQLNLGSMTMMGIKLTDSDGNEYPDYQLISGKKVYLKVPNMKSGGGATESHGRNLETSSGDFEYKRVSDDGYDVYSYVIKSGGRPNAVRARAAAEGLADKKDEILVTKRSGKPYEENHDFSAGDKVYVKVPKRTDGRANGRTEISQPPSTSQSNPERQQESIEMRCKGGEYFGIDISHFNEKINLDEFKKWNRKKWDSEKQDHRGVSFIYIRASDGITVDSRVENHVSKIKNYNESEDIKNNHEQVAVGFYHRMNGQDVSKNVDIFIKTYNKYKDTTGGTNLVPMLDIEGKRVDASSKKKVRERALTWLKMVEKSTGVVPGLYVTASLYKKYFMNDSRFNKYLKRLTAYPSEDKKTKREKGTARRIDFKEGSVNVGSKSNPVIVKPDMYQSSQEGTVDGTYAIVIENKDTKYEKEYHDTDMDHTKNISKLFSENNLSRV